MVRKRGMLGRIETSVAWWIAIGGDYPEHEHGDRLAQFITGRYTGLN